VCAALFVALVPSITAAQGRGIFVDAGPMIGIRFTPSAEGDPTLFSLNGTLRMVAFNQDWNVRPTIVMRWQP
jgi:hypothetical protein